MKRRLDVVLAERGLAESRERARSLIMEGDVYVDGARAGKAGMQVTGGERIELRESALPFVSRGGLKLAKALDVFPIDLTGLVCADVGASTGGFTDCMLQRGAARVYALDVGYGQLHYKLRSDPRVTVMERTNARFMEPNWFPEQPQFASVDVSFISLRLILPPLRLCLAQNAAVVALVKPQFEAGRAEVGKHGVVREIKTHKRVLAEIIRFAYGTEYTVEGLSFSPITGPKGNIEFLLFLRNKTGFSDDFFAKWGPKIDEIAAEAHISCI